MKKLNNQVQGAGSGCLTNEMLMAQSAGGDEIAFRKLVDKNNGWLVEITFHLNGDEERAKDIVLEFWIKAWKDLRNGENHEQGDCEGWMKTGAFFKMLSDLKKEAKHPHESLPEKDIEKCFGREDAGILDYEKMQKLYEAERFMTCLQKKVVNMHVLYDMTNAEISKKLHVALKEIKEAYKEGIRELRKRYLEVDKTIH
jgi:DNA-directed RNA polymerase specialized sigma24 family protein